MKSAILIASVATLAIAAPALGQSAHPMAQEAGSKFGVTSGDDHNAAPIYYFFRANRLGYGASQGGALASWDIDARIGTDEHRLVFKSEGQYVRGKGENAEIQLLYATPITEFFDFQVGARQLFAPAGRSYFAMGVQGILPWFINTEATLFVSDQGQPSIRVKSEVDVAWTGRIYSRPSVEMNAYAADDRKARTYAGVGTVKLALQTRYQITRQIAPYVEIGWERSLGRTGIAARQAGERTENAYSVVGLRLLY